MYKTKHFIFFNHILNLLVYVSPVFASLKSKVTVLMLIFSPVFLTSALMSNHCTMSVGWTDIFFILNHKLSVTLEQFSLLLLHHVYPLWLGYYEVLMCNCQAVFACWEDDTLWFLDLRLKWTNSDRFLLFQFTVCISTWLMDSELLLVQLLGINLSLTGVWTFDFLSQSFP